MERHDEYFTSLKEVEKELPFYKVFFKNKVVFANANDNPQSAFFKFFTKNFHSWELKHFYSLSLDGILYSYNGEILEQEQLMERGDFLSTESVDILKKSDIIVTNPPFSLFRAFFDLLIENKKQFLIIGNHNASGYKSIFPYIKDRKVWYGVNIPKIFYNYKGKKQQNVAGLCRWFTNLKHKQENPFLTLTEEYTPEKYPKNNLHSAINCNEVKNIPKDYFDPIGVPISFLDKWNDKQFSIIGIEREKGETRSVRLIICQKKYSSFLSVKELAKRANLSEASIRKYIRKNKISRREEKKEIVFNQIHSLLTQNPSLSIRGIARELKLSPTTVSKYLQKRENFIFN